MPDRGRAVLAACAARVAVSVLGMSLALSGCQRFPGHPVRLSAPRLAAEAARPEPGVVPEPAHSDDAQRRASLFLGLEGVLRRLDALHALPRPAGEVPRYERLPEVGRSVRRRYRRGGFGGPVRHVVVLGVTGRVPLTPQAMADLMLDHEVERQVLAASSFRPLGLDFDVPGHRRERNRVELLGVGFGPIRFNLRFNIVAERCDLADGSVLLRYDPALEPRNERVTLYRGGARLEPLPDGGTRVTELVILGTSIDVAPMFLPPLLKMAGDTLHNRATNLW
ncbi:MAG: hypothetical protein P1V36_16295, partial [Planctomycetota bacterium]|nr:hypothetical protein [Planctomycetota bacterium]